MIRVTNKIDGAIQMALPGYGLRMMGLSELVKKENSKWPVTIDTREKIAIDDRYDGLLYHRVISSTTGLNPDLDYGLRIATQYSVTLRTFLMYVVGKGESFKYHVRNVFPSITRIPGFDFINVIPTGMNEDHEGIMNSEFINVPYHKHRLPWNVVSFDNTIEFVLCKDDCVQNL